MVLNIVLIVASRVLLPEDSYLGGAASFCSWRILWSISSAILMSV